MSTLYKVTHGHQMGLVRAAGMDDAYDYMERRLGTDAEIVVEMADENDESWFEMMGGGYTYETPAARQEDKEAAS